MSDTIKPVAKLWQHGETGRTMIREIDQPDSALQSSWAFVCYLYTAAALRQARNAALEEAERVCMAIANKPSNAVLGDAVACAAAIRALISESPGP